jgi:hypothetical protein
LVDEHFFLRAVEPCIFFLEHVTISPRDFAESGRPTLSDLGITDLVLNRRDHNRLGLRIQSFGRTSGSKGLDRRI